MLGSFIDVPSRCNSWYSCDSFEEVMADYFFRVDAICIRFEVGSKFAHRRRSACMFSEPIEVADEN